VRSAPLGHTRTRLASRTTELARRALQVRVCVCENTIRLLFSKPSLLTLSHFTGTWSSTVGATNSSACVLCSKGTYSLAVGAIQNVCVVCGKGKYGNTTGAGTEEMCYRCPKVFPQGVFSVQVLLLQTNTFFAVFAGHVPGQRGQRQHKRLHLMPCGDVPERCRKRASGSLQNMPCWIVLVHCSVCCVCHLQCGILHFAVTCVVVFVKNIINIQCTRKQTRNISARLPAPVSNSDHQVCTIPTLASTACCCRVA
jgi:hypothetical protein